MTLTNQQGGSLEEARRDLEERRDAAALVPRLLLRQVSFDGLEFDAAVRPLFERHPRVASWSRAKVSTHWSNYMIAKLWQGCLKYTPALPAWSGWEIPVV